MHTMRRFKLSCECAKYHAGLCSPFTHSVVSDDSVSGQWSPSQTARMRFHIARPTHNAAHKCFLLLGFIYLFIYLYNILRELHKRMNTLFYLYVGESIHLVDIRQFDKENIFVTSCLLFWLHVCSFSQKGSTLKTVDRFSEGSYYPKSVSVPLKIGNRLCLIWPRGYIFFMLNSAEHEICPANKSQITNICELILTN